MSCRHSSARKPFTERMPRTRSRSGLKVWPTPDVLPLEVWATKEIERRCASGERLSRLLTPAEDWLLWRQCTGPLTDEMQLVARGPLADALRRGASARRRVRHRPAHDARAARQRGPTARRCARAVAERTPRDWCHHACGACRRLSPAVGGSRDVLLAGFERVTPRLAMLTTSRGCWAVSPSSARRSAQRKDPARPCRAGRRPERRAGADCGLVSGAPHRTARRAPAGDRARARPKRRSGCSHSSARTSIRSARRSPRLPGWRAIRSPKWLAGHHWLAAPLAAYALQSLAWLSGGTEFAEFSAWLCSPHWTMPAAGRASLDLWLRERSPLEMDTRKLLTVLERVPRALQPIASELRSRVTDAASKLSGGATTPRQWSVRSPKGAWMR